MVNQATFEPQSPFYQEYSLSQELEASLRVMHPTLAEGVDDMINLGEMSEAGLLRNLMLRHKRGLVYVRTHKRLRTAEKNRFPEATRSTPEVLKSLFLSCRPTSALCWWP